MRNIQPDLRREKLGIWHINQLENYGIIGDLNTIALISLEGSIDFMCFDFDSPTIFAALLDDDKGGFFSIKPEFREMNTQTDVLRQIQMLLLTRFLSVDGVGGDH